MPAFCYHFHLSPAEFWALTYDEYVVLSAALKELARG
jgi:hypothetical protein